MAVSQAPTTRRIIPALLLSLLLHGLVLWGHLLGASKPPPPPPVLNVTLARPPDEEPLLKNTLDDGPVETPAEAPPPPRTIKPEGKPHPAPTPKPATLSAAQRKLADHLYYPPQAVAAGLQGDVQLLLTLDSTGAIQEAEVAVSSGHPVLDQAAVRAAYAMGRVEGVTKREMLLPVSFRLR